LREREEKIAKLTIQHLTELQFIKI